MKPLFFICCALLTARFATAQVQWVAGPELGNDRDVKMNRLLKAMTKAFTVTVSEAGERELRFM
jgi:hypothetical protein